MGGVRYCYEEALDNVTAILNLVEQRLLRKEVSSRALLRTALAELQRAKTRFGERTYIIAYRERPHLEPAEFAASHRDLARRVENMLNDLGFGERILFTFNL